MGLGSGLPGVHLVSTAELAQQPSCHGETVAV